MDTDNTDRDEPLFPELRELRSDVGECTCGDKNTLAESENLWKKEYIKLVERLGEEFKKNCIRCKEETGEAPVYTDLEAEFALIEADATLKMDELLDREE